MHDNTDLIQSLATTLSDGILTINGAGRIIAANEPACFISGYSKGELVGQAFSDLFPPQITDSIDSHPVERILRSKKQTSFESKPRGREMKISLLPFNGEGVVPAITVRAVAILKSTQTLPSDDDPRAARIQMVGHFATGVAHDVNNDLTAVMCSIQFAHSIINQALSRLGEAHTEYKELVKAQTHLEDTESITRRTATLTKQLLAYARQKHTEKQAVNLNEAIRETLSLVNKIIGDQVRIETNLAQLLPPVLAERSQIDRILTNLILNARDAMSESGIITIQTTWVYLDEDFTKNRPPWAKTGRYVKLSISDTGKGMDEETLNRIYEEFFTTKAKGTGLGLRTVYQIVKDNNGMIEAHSKPNDGTRFDIYLPPTEKRDAKAITRADQPRGSLTVSQPRSEFQILVAESKPHVFALMKEIIEQAGYRVLGATTGEQALKAYREAHSRGEEISLSILDFGLPDADGRSVKDEIRKMDREAVIMFTGSSDVESDAAGVSRDYEFLQKPFDGYRLLDAIEVALEKRFSAAS